MCIDAGCCPAEKYVEESHKVTRIHSGIYLQTLAAGGSEQRWVFIANEFNFSVVRGRMCYSGIVML